jgi:hypothetical protein
VDTRVLDDRMRLMSPLRVRKLATMPFAPSAYAPPPSLVMTSSIRSPIVTMVGIVLPGLPWGAPAERFSDAAGNNTRATASSTAGFGV